MTNNRKFFGLIVRYLILLGVSYLILINTPIKEKLKQNDILLVALAISLVFALIDLYGGFFNRLFKFFCDCDTSNAPVV